MDVALPVDGACFDQHVLGLAAVRAGIHAQRAADRARDAAIEGEARDAGIRCGARDLHVGHGRAGAQAVARLDLDLGEAAAEADDDARHAAVAHQQVRAEPDDEHGKSAGMRARK